MNRTFPRLSVLLLTIAGAAAAAPPLDGTLDPSFHGDGRRTVPFDLNPQAPIDAGRDVVVDAEGRIYLVGTVTANGVYQIGITRLLRNGLYDLDYGTSGKVIAPPGLDVTGMKATLDAQGHLLVGGSRQFTGTDTDFAVCRFDPDGNPAVFEGGVQSCVTIAFDIGGNNTDALRAVAVDGQGRIVLAGNVGFSDTLVRAGVARLLPSGIPDPGFGVGGRQHFLISGQQRHDVMAMRVQDNGKVVLVGSTTAVGQGDRDGMVARLTASGHLDTSFHVDGFQSYIHLDASRDMAFHAVAFDVDGLGLEPDLYVAGEHEQAPGSGTYSGLVAHLTPGGATMGSFGSNGFVGIGNGHDLSLTGVFQRSDSRLVVTGTTTPVQGQDSDFFAMSLRRDGTADLQGFAAPNGRIDIDLLSATGQDTAVAVVQAQDRLYIVGSTLHGAQPVDLDYAVVALHNDRIFASSAESNH